jgi:hypothetical protein
LAVWGGLLAFLGLVFLPGGDDKSRRRTPPAHKHRGKECLWPSLLVRFAAVLCNLVVKWLTR